MSTTFSQFISNIYTSFIFQQLVPAVIVFFLGWFLAGKLTVMIRKAMIKYKLDESIISFSNSLLKIGLRGIVILMVAACFGVNISSIITALGAALVTVGLALKDNLSNAASGVIIITNKPFKIGDTLETKDVKGRVTKIELLFTTLTTPDNKEIVIPNSNLTSSYVINSTANNKRRLDISLPIKKSTKFVEVQPILESLVKDQENILKSPVPSIEIEGFDEDAVNIVISVWCESKKYSIVEKSLFNAIKTEFDSNNIDF